MFQILFGGKHVSFKPKVNKFRIFGCKMIFIEPGRYVMAAKSTKGRVSTFCVYSMITSHNR